MVVDEEKATLEPKQTDSKPTTGSSSGGFVTATGLKVLALLAIQNCSKNLIMRYAVKDKPNFLYSAAVIGSELTKLTLSTLYILIVDKGSLMSIINFMRLDWWNSVLLTVPASVYNLQQTLEYIALSNLDAAIFSVLVQSKLIFTAVFAVFLMGRKLRKAQVISLVLLTTGVMLANLRTGGEKEASAGDVTTGVLATLGISTASGFAAVYTEKVMKSQKNATTFDRSQYSLAYMQVQLASISLIVMGAWAIAKDFNAIMSNGLWHNVNGAAFVVSFVPSPNPTNERRGVHAPVYSHTNERGDAHIRMYSCLTYTRTYTTIMNRQAIVNSALGGLTVAGVLKYADAVLKGYATAVSVILTGVISMMLFGTELGATYGLGMINVVLSITLYNAKGLDENMCH
jgi:UDP-sugar transporter A1/2/3